jgi:hypothetical protein
LPHESSSKSQRFASLLHPQRDGIDELAQPDLSSSRSARLAVTFATSRKLGEPSLR